jgi:hypothetical protein
MAGNPLASLPGLPQRPPLARSSASETRLTQPGIEGARSRKLNSAPTADFRFIAPLRPHSTMAKLSKKVPPPRGAWARRRTRSSGRAATVAADQRSRILERLTRVEELGVRQAPEIIAAMLESREIDPPAGFVRCRSPVPVELDRYLGLAHARILRRRSPSPHDAPRRRGDRSCRIRRSGSRCEIFRIATHRNRSKPRKNLGNALPCPLLQGRARVRASGRARRLPGFRRRGAPTPSPQRRGGGNSAYTRTGVSG